MADALSSTLSGVMNAGGQALQGAENLGGSALKGIGDIGGAIGKEAMALPGQVEGLFGMGPKDPTGVSASGNPIANAAAGGVNGSVGPSGVAAAAAGTSGAGSAASAAPFDLNYGSSPISTPQIPAGPGSVPTTPSLSGAADVQGLQLGPGGAPVTSTPALSGASGLPDASGYTAQAAEAASHPLVATPQIGGGRDGLQQTLSTMTGPGGAAHGAAGAAQPNAIQSLIHTLTQPDMLKMELPGALFGINALNAMKPTSQEKTMKAALANAQRQQAGEQNLLNSEQAGYVPAALQQGIDLKEQQAEAAVRQRYAQAGMSGSTAEAADIAAAKTDAALQTFQEAQSLIGQTGQLLGGYNSEVGQYMSSLFAAESARDAALRQSIVGFLSAAGYAQPGEAASKH